MTTTVLGLLAGLVLLYLGAEALVRGAAALGLKLGLTPLVIGLTIVAFGTSAPELLVSVQAGLSDQGPMAIGNVVGSSETGVNKRWPTTSPSRSATNARQGDSSGRSASTRSASNGVGNAAR